MINTTPTAPTIAKIIPKAIEEFSGGTGTTVGVCVELVGHIDLAQSTPAKQSLQIQTNASQIPLLLQLFSHPIPISSIV
jgi:hypothetical protein